MSVVTMMVEDHLLADICANPNEMKYLNILGDYFTDKGMEKEADCVNWMVSEKKRPYITSDGQGTWFNEEKITTDLGDSESNIPPDIYKNLKNGKVTANHTCFATVKEAYERLIEAWKLTR